MSEVVQADVERLLRLLDDPQGHTVSIWAMFGMHHLRDMATGLLGLQAEVARLTGERDALQSRFDDFGPLFYRDLCRLVGLPDDAPLDRTMNMVTEYFRLMVDAQVAADVAARDCNVARTDRDRLAAALAEAREYVTHSTHYFCGTGVNADCEAKRELDALVARLDAAREGRV